jgi:hypothetical protein
MPGNYIIDSFGLKTALLVNGIFLIIGVWIRTLIDYNFWFVIIGNGIAGVGLNMILTGSPKVSFKWFSTKNCPIITSILMMGQAVGFVISFWLP